MATPSKTKILEFWWDREDLYSKTGFLIDWGEPTCWACGFWWGTRYDVNNAKATKQDCLRAWEKAPLQRCHVIPRSLGGTDLPSNLVLMCAKCHDLSPDTIYPDMFFQWMRSQNFVIREHTEFVQALKDLGKDPEDDQFIDTLVAKLESKQFQTWFRSNAGIHGNQLPPYGLHISKSTLAAALILFDDKEHDSIAVSSAHPSPFRDREEGA